MNRNTYQVVMSADGNHKVIVTLGSPIGIDTALAWAKDTYGKLQARASIKTPQPGVVGNGHRHKELGLFEGETPECEIHNIPMVRVEGRRGPFWSCHEKNPDGSWCNYRPGGQRNLANS